MAAAALIARRPTWGLLLVCAIAGALPDIDFLLPIRHRGPSHSLAVAAVAYAAALGVLSLRWSTPDRWRTAAAIGTAYATHMLLDWLGADSSAPRGLMALWPVSTAYYISGLDIFNAVDRRYWLPGFWTRTAVALLRELAVLGPLALFSMYRSRARSSVRAAPRPPSA